LGVAEENTVWRLLTLQKCSVWDIPPAAGRLAAIWLCGCAGLLGIDLLLTGYPRLFDLSEMLFRPGMGSLAAALGIWILGGRGEFLRLAYMMTVILVVALLAERTLVTVQFESDFVVFGEFTLIDGLRLLLALWTALAGGLAMRSTGLWMRSGRRVLAGSAAGLTLLLAMQAPSLTQLMTRALYAERTPDEPPPIDFEQLWTAQPGLVNAGLARLPKTSPTKPTIFIVTVAAGGSQQIFGREAGRVGKLLEQRYSAAGTGLVLSNAQTDLLAKPMANRTNLSGTLSGIGRKYDPAKDVLVLYLAAHGSREAALQTDLPDYTGLKPISASYLSRQLATAGITRRVVIISSCYAGTWKPFLASPDTIVIAAAAPDRTSFGCDDQRTYTRFGQAFINGLGTPGRSLEQVFNAARQEVERDERSSSGLPSNPESFVGSRMMDWWNQRPSQ